MSTGEARESSRREVQCEPGIQQVSQWLALRAAVLRRAVSWWSPLSSPVRGCLEAVCPTAACGGQRCPERESWSMLQPGRHHGQQRSRAELKCALTTHSSRRPASAVRSVAAVPSRCSIRTLGRTATSSGRMSRSRPKSCQGKQPSVSTAEATAPETRALLAALCSWP